MGNNRVSITYGGEVYDRTALLHSGDIQPRGVDLRYLQMDIEDLFWRQSRNGEFDVAEYSLGAYLASVQKPDWDFIGLPIFPSKAFRHSAIYVHTESGIRTPKDLEGRTIGTPEWSMTASLWLRGILSEHYGVDLRRIRWRTGGLDQPGRSEKSGMQPPEQFDIAPLPDNNTLGQAFFARQIDALVCARTPLVFRDSPHMIGSLFADLRSEEQAYFAATNIFPIMHIVVMRKSLAKEHPWLANSLVNAFKEAQQRSIDRLMDPGFSVSSLAWEASYAREEAKIMGNAFAHGISENRTTLEALCRYAHDQGFTKRLLTIADLFEPSTLAEHKG
jgi:4,5-dihydroxyphthalate decarboxylase